MLDQEKLQLNNKGFTLAEMLIALLVMSFLVVGVVLSVQIIPNQKAEDCGERIMAFLENGKIDTMAKEAVPLEVRIFKGEDNRYYGAVLPYGDAVTDQTETEKLAGSDLSLYVGEQKVPLTELNIQYDRASGAFLDNPQLFSQGTGQIIIEGAKTARVVLVQRTGRCYMEKE